MLIKVTARELLNKGRWIEACEMLGINEWAINEGLMDSEDVLELTETEAVELGLISRERDYL